MCNSCTSCFDAAVDLWAKHQATRQGEAGERIRAKLALAGGDVRAAALGGRGSAMRAGRHHEYQVRPCS